MSVFNIILIVAIAYIALSIINTRRRVKYINDRLENVKSNKNEAEIQEGIGEKISILDRYMNYYILSDEGDVYSLKADEKNLEPIGNITDISMKEKYEQKGFGWAACEELRFAVVKIISDKGEFETMFHSEYMDDVKQFINGVRERIKNNEIETV